MDNIKLIIENKTIYEIFKNHKIKRAYAFGSVLTDKFNKNSDLDFLINFKKEIEPLEKGELWWNLHDKLRELFNREIDIVIEESLKNPYFIKEIKNNKQLIYEQ